MSFELTLEIGASFAVVESHKIYLCFVLHRFSGSNICHVSVVNVYGIQSF